MVAAFVSRWQAPLWFFLLAALAAPSALADQVGFQLVTIPDPPGELLKVGIWYPTKAAAADADIGLFTQTVATNGEMDGQARGLIVMSHGNGGSLVGHYDTALELARAGFVVAAMTHTGDNYQDQSRATQLADRPRAVRAVIDYMLSAWPQHAAIDAAKIGVFGFSSGGFTALVSIGGVPDLAAIEPYCASHANAYVCGVLKAHPINRNLPVRAEDWIADRRIKAAVVAAPAIGFTFSPAGLQTVRVPIQLWRAGDDHILPSPDYADAVLHALTLKPEYHDVPGADHFDFLAPCSDRLAQVAPDICQERGGFDRTVFHGVFNREVVRFFKTTLH